MSAPDLPPEQRVVYIALVPGEDRTTHRIRSALQTLADVHLECRNRCVSNATQQGCPPAIRAQELASADYHTAELYAIGELVERFGGRNAWPRPAAAPPTTRG